MRHRRHHAALREAQLPRQGRQGRRADDQEGVLSRGDRPPRPGAGRHPEGRDPGEDRVELPEVGLAALVQPCDQGACRADQEGRTAAARRQEADGLRRRRRRAQQRGAPVDAPRAAARFSVHEHADGSGGVPRHRPAVHRHARHARHLRVEHGDAALRRADRDRRPVRRPRHRQPAALLPQRPQDHPHRHRSVVDLEAGQGRRADRRLRRRRPRRDAEADRDFAAASRPGRAEGVVGPRSRNGSARTASGTTRRASSSSRSTWSRSSTS